jgi:hypothetical protein
MVHDWKGAPIPGATVRIESLNSRTSALSNEIPILNFKFPIIGEKYIRYFYKSSVFCYIFDGS